MKPQTRRTVRCTLLHMSESPTVLHLTAALRNLREVVAICLEEEGTPPRPTAIPPLVTSIDVPIPAA